jgi:hypothetical protein
MVWNKHRNTRDVIPAPSRDPSRNCTTAAGGLCRKTAPPTQPPPGEGEEQIELVAPSLFNPDPSLPLRGRLGGGPSSTNHKSLPFLPAPINSRYPHPIIPE